MTDLSLIPEMAWCEAEPCTAGIWWRHGRPPFRSAEVDSGKYHSTIELWCNINDVMIHGGDSRGRFAQHYYCARPRLAGAFAMSIRYPDLRYRPTPTIALLG